MRSRLRLVIVLVSMPLSESLRPLLLPMFLISPLASPSCFTPIVQQRAPGLDAIVIVFVRRHCVTGMEEKVVCEVKLMFRYLMETLK